LRGCLRTRVQTQPQYRSADVVDSIYRASAQHTVWIRKPIQCFTCLRRLTVKILFASMVRIRPIVTVAILVVTVATTVLALRVSGYDGTGAIASYDLDIDVTGGGNVTFAAPMHQLTIAGKTVVGTDAADCTSKDPSGAAVAVFPTSSYLEFKFAVSQRAYHAFRANVYVPDELSTSFFFQRDNSLDFTSVSFSNSRTMYKSWVDLTTDATDATADSCFLYEPGAYNVRFYTRSIGAAIGGLEVVKLRPPSMMRVVGCNPTCHRDGLDAIKIYVAFFCGPSMMRPDMITVDGHPCLNVTLAARDTIECITPNVLARPEARTVLVEFNSVDETTGITFVSSRVALKLADAVVVHVTNLDSTSALGAILGTIAGVLVLLAAATLGFAFLRRGGARDVANAPQSGEITILFTDVEQSTDLWANYTVSMAAALDVHHAVVRRAIARHGGYEVKTVGDSFMIAAKTAEAGLLIARDIQVNLMAEAVPRCITRHYEGETLEDEPSDTHVAEAGAAFHGLRVRIGMHTGTPEVVFDEVAKGYDYYGPDVNMAARIESKALGGQILVSDATVTFISAADLGISGGTRSPVELKGIRNVVHVTSLSIHAIPLRRYAEFDDSHSMMAKSISPRPALLGDHLASPIGGAARSVEHLPIDLDTHIDHIAAKVGLLPPVHTNHQHLSLRLGFLEAMLRPLPASLRHKCLSSLYSGWRLGEGPNVKTLSHVSHADLLPLLSRIVPAERGRGALLWADPLTSEHDHGSPLEASSDVLAITGLPRSSADVSKEHPNALLQCECDV
jgi:class 3 adenylate cyclase